MGGAPAKTILVVDDEKNVCDLFARTLRKEGYEVDGACGGEEALEAIRRKKYALVITDLKMPKVNGVKVLKEVKSSSPGSDVMIITGYATVENAVEVMQEGACDYVTKPLNLAELRQKVKDIFARRDLETEVAVLKGRLRTKEGLGELLGATTVMQRVYDLIEKMQANECSVLIWGESGTGKELVARAIHYGGDKKESPFVAINCAALPETILERELFGHARGAYTGADEARDGYFQTASGGTLFLDEIDSLGLAMQAKLLRAIEERKIYRLGDPKPIDVSVRILAATNIDPQKAVAEGTLRNDLYFRLNVVTIALPPLRERKEDIPVLADHFLKRYCAKYGKQARAFSPAAMKDLFAHDWPGNVRELENVVEKTVVLAGGGSEEIGAVELGIGGIPGGASDQESAQEGGYSDMKKRAMEDFEIRNLRAALDRSGGNVTEAAKELGIGRTALQRLLAKYGISSKGFKPGQD